MKDSVGQGSWSSTAGQTKKNMEEKYEGVEEVSTAHGADTRQKWVEDHH